MSFFVDKFLGERRGGGRVKQLIGSEGARVFQGVDARLSSSRKNRQLRGKRWRRGGALRQCVSASGTIHESKRVRLIDRLFRAIDVFHSLPRQETKIIPVKP